MLTRRSFMGAVAALGAMFGVKRKAETRKHDPETCPHCRWEQEVIASMHAAERELRYGGSFVRLTHLQYTDATGNVIEV